MYEFKTEDAERFAHAIGIKTKHVGNEIAFFSCPYCKGGANKDKFTFSINSKTGQFECKRGSCQAKGNMISIARDFSEYFELSNEVTRYYNIDNFNNKFRKFKQAHRKESDTAAIDYLQSRGISADITKSYGIAVSEGEYKGRLAIPFYNDKKELVSVKYRKLDETDQGPKELFLKNCMPILFGMDHCDPERSKTLVITEGQIDSLSLAEAGIANAVSVPSGKKGFTWVPHCWDFLTQFDELIIFGDNENGKITLVDELRTRFPKLIKVVRVEDYKGCKDANEILQQYGRQALIDAVFNAQILPSEYLVDMADVNIVDLNTIPCISTGFKTIDSYLEGGLHAGQLCIVSGKCGDGKSTFVSQIVANTIEQNFKTIIYSGELTTSNVKQWLYQQIANRKRLLNPDINKIDNWVRGNVFLYDSSTVSDEIQDIPGIIETSMKQYEVKLAVVDNLMTAMNGNSADLYQAQSVFVGKLAKLAKVYDSVIILVAHPRKGEGLDNDYVSGSADITNKADLVMRYDRYKVNNEAVDADGCDRFLRITKNRLTGRLVKDNSIGLYYDNDSKRIVDRHDKDFTHIYPPFIDQLGFISVDENNEQDIPF